MERRLRLVTGLTLFAYATCHFLSHATGLFGLGTLDGVGRKILLAPWQNLVGHTAIFSSLFVHGTLGLQALYRRRHLRIPAGEAWQLALGLSLPILLIPHAIDVRIGSAAFGLDDSYYRILYYYWLTVPGVGLTRQFLLLFVAWAHGCLGIHFWLRYRPWYARAAPFLATAAILIPFLAVLGLVNAGWDTAMQGALLAGFASAHGPPPAGSPNAVNGETLQRLWTIAQAVYAALVASVFLARLLRDLARRRRPLRIAYPDGRIVQVPRGFSILEASRWSRIPHASICGGRGRCSTCRIRVMAADDALPEPSTIEQETLDRIAAPPGIRLACQLRPDGDVAVAPLLPANMKHKPIPAAEDFGRELELTALFIDLRDSTRLAAGRLPFDALFIANCYVQRVMAAVKRHDGNVTSVAGDGIMAAFGLSDAREGTNGIAFAGLDRTAAGARNALMAALAICRDLDGLSRELEADLERPLAFGIGLHVGLSAVGRIVDDDRPSMLFLGDAGNVAARLEALTKDQGCRIIVSCAVFAAAGRDLPPKARRMEVRLRGREAFPLEVVILEAADTAPSAASRHLSGDDRP